MLILLKKENNSEMEAVKCDFIVIVCTVDLQMDCPGHET